MILKQQGVQIAMKLTFFGDVYLADGEKTFEVDVSKYMPYVFNFEYAHYDKETPHALNKALLKSSVDIADTFDPLPIAVDVNNNHVFDYGQPGILSTLDYLKEKNIGCFGSGRKAEHYHNPCMLELDSKKVALLGYYHRARDRDALNSNIEFASFSEELFLDDVKRCKELGADLIIPSIHWGVEHSPGFSKKQQQAGRFMIDNGADLVIGHHPHCIQPWEKYKDKYIFYSLGNFVFHEIYTKSWYTDETHSSCMHCKRWHKWSRKSLGVSYDLESGAITLHKMYQKHGKVKELDIPQDAIFSQYKEAKHTKIRTLFRKTVLAFSCFFFFHGHIFYWPGFRETVKLFFSMHIKAKDWTYPE